MIFLDHYIFLLMIFSPLSASFFITLIPTTDTGSKLTVSRFFALIGFAAFARVLVIYLNHSIQTETALSFSVINFNISLTLLLTKYNIFLYGAAASSLLANVFLYEIRDTKTNIHQVAPFLLTFFLYISFGQADLRVALPLLSIANFLVYFLIGFADQVRRGSTIFQMGIFLFACDALALVLLQIPFSDRATINQTAIINAFLLVPGFARLGLPLVAPFMKKLLLNVDVREGPFLLVFLQLAGIFTIIMAKTNVDIRLIPLVIVVVCVGTISSMYVALLAFIEDKLRAMPYYFLLFYTSLAAISLFFADDDSIWPFAITLFLTNLACFYVTTYAANFIDDYRAKEVYSPGLAPLWFITQSLLFGLPGLGIGTALWALFYRFLSLGLFYQDQPLRVFWLVFSVVWLASLLSLSCAAMLSVQRLLALKETSLSKDAHVPVQSALIFGPVIVAIISLAIPIVIFYARLQGV